MFKCLPACRALWRAFVFDSCWKTLALLHEPPIIHTIENNRTITLVLIPRPRLHHHREVRPAHQHVDPGGQHEWPAATVRRGGDRQQAVRGRGAGRLEDLQHGRVLQPRQQGVVHHAPHVHAPPRPGWARPLTLIMLTLSLTLFHKLFLPLAALQTHCSW